MKFPAVRALLFGLLSTSALAHAETALFDETKAVTLFAFDSTAIPFSQNLQLRMRQPQRHPANPVLRRGAPGSVDAFGVQFYGSVIRERGKFRLWYVAVDDDFDNPVPYSRWRAAYAESDDGVGWTKPELGLVEFGGDKRNNLIATDPAPLGFVNLKVLLDRDEPDPARRYKISTHVYFKHNTRLGTLAPFASADGLTWRCLVPARPEKALWRKEDLVLPGVHFEPCGGLYQWDGQYYVCGQNAMGAARPYHGRVTRMYRSTDFTHWSATSSIGFVRAAQHTLLGAGRSLEGEQTHEGISVWNRGTVLLGVVGLWHGAAEWKDVSVDLGFVLSNDGLRFREPAPEWVFLRRGEDGDWDQGGLLQGQGFENVGEQTFVYYGAWDPRQTKSKTPRPRGGVGIATLPRDRFADLVVDKTAEGPGDYQLPVVRGEFVTASHALVGGKAYEIFVNAAGLGPESFLKIELLDAQERPLPRYSGENAATVRQSGFQTPVIWHGASGLTDLPERIRIRVSFEGSRATDARFSALYLKPRD